MVILSCESIVSCYKIIRYCVLYNFMWLVLFFLNEIYKCVLKLNKFYIVVVCNFVLFMM